MRATHVGDGPATLPDKDPNDKVWYGVIWDAELESGVSISASEWITDLTVEADLVASSMTVDGVAYSAVNKVLLSGGTVGQSYLVTNRVTLSDQQRLDRSFYVSVSEQ